MVHGLTKSRQQRKGTGIDELLLLLSITMHPINYLSHDDGM
jgi:hypothetical protein